jgi:hypothetical protein
MSIAHEPLGYATPAPQLGLLDQLRARIRRYIVAEGVFAGLAWLFASFWITLAIDWTFEPPRVVRALMLVAVAGVLGYLLNRYWFQRTSVPLSDTNMALLVERKYRGFRDSLITSVELREQPGHARAFHPDMLAKTEAEAAKQLHGVKLGEIFNNTTIGSKILLAVALGISIIVFGVMQPPAIKTWAERMLLLSEELWPRYTGLEIEGFADKVRKVGVGGETTVIVKADLFKEVPKDVKITYTYQEGGRETQDMPILRRDSEFQYHVYKFAGLTNSVKFDIRGGDARLRDYKIEVVDNPTLSDLHLVAHYPAYMGRSDQTLKAAGLMQIPLGTELILRGRANKPLVDARLDVFEGEKKTIHSAKDDSTASKLKLKNPLEVEYNLGTLLADQSLSFHLRDVDGIESREGDAVRLNLTVRPDESPRVGLRLSGIGSAITPFATLPMVGDVEDDYGLSRVWIEYHVEQAADTRQRTLPLPAVAENKQLRKQIEWSPKLNPEQYKTYEPELYIGLDLQQIQEQEKAAAERAAREAKPEAKEPAEKPADDKEPAKPDAAEAPSAAVPKKEIPVPFKLEVGQKLNVMTKAVDNSTLAAGALVGVGEKYQLEIVTKEQMAAILEAREVNLRQRFETIVNEFQMTRDNLEAIRFKATPKKTATDVLDDPDEKKPMVTTEQIQERLDAERPALTERALEKIERSAFECNELSRAFLDIMEEFINNRITTPENEKRLRDQIAEPLKKVSKRIIDPETNKAETLKQQLTELRKLVADQTRGPEQQQAAIKLADSILAEMKGILEKMLELEDYNALLSKLRKLIDEGDGQGPKIKQLQKQKLLED